MKNSEISILIFMLILLLASLAYGQNGQEQTPWVAPPEADKLENPIQDKSIALALGRRIYLDDCMVCHGRYGNAETDIAATLLQKPKDFTKEDFLKQTDGAIYWKLSEGRGLMQPFKIMLTEEEIWSVVMYVKELAEKED